MQIEYSKSGFPRRNWRAHSAMLCCVAATLLMPISATRVFAKPERESKANRGAKVLRNSKNNVSATQILGQMMNAERNANYSASETISRADSAPIELRVSRLGRKRFLQYTAPEIRRGDVLVDNGQKTWLYHRAENAVVQTNSPAPRTPQNRALHAKISGETRLGNRAAWIVEVTREGKSGASSTRSLARRFWIDKATHLRLSMQTFSPDGQSLERSTLSDVKIGGVSDARFRWNPPAGAQVVRTSGTLFSQFAGAQRAASWLQFPRFVPDDYNFESAIVDSAKGEAWLRYASSSRRFSLFQQRIAAQKQTQANAATTPQKVDGSWYRSANGSRLLIVGAPDDLAQKILQSVR